jgi:hypothetical protein
MIFEGLPETDRLEVWLRMERMRGTLLNEIGDQSGRCE